MFKIDNFDTINTEVEKLYEHCGHRSFKDVEKDSKDAAAKLRVLMLRYQSAKRDHTLPIIRNIDLIFDGYDAYKQEQCRAIAKNEDEYVEAWEREYDRQWNSPAAKATRAQIRVWEAENANSDLRGK